MLTHVRQCILPADVQALVATAFNASSSSPLPLARAVHPSHMPAFTLSLCNGQACKMWQVHNHCFCLCVIYEWASGPIHSSRATWDSGRRLRSNRLSQLYVQGHLKRRHKKVVPRIRYRPIRPTFKHAPSFSHTHDASLASALRNSIRQIKQVL